MGTRRLVVVIVVGVALLAGCGITLLRTSTAGCAYPAPVPSLPDQLRAVGGFDQPFDPSDVRGLDDAALQSSSSLHPDLIGSSAGSTVDMAATSASVPGATVIPLRRSPTSSSAGASGPPVVGLVAFLRDCSGRLYFHAVEDERTPLTNFPTVTRSAASTQLGTTSVTLAYTTDPFTPVWQAATGRRVAAINR